MKNFSRLAWGIAALTVAAWTLAASELPAYAPKDANVICFADLNRIANSRLVQELFQTDPELKQKRDDFVRSFKDSTGLEWDEFLNSEICVFGNFTEKEPAFQILTLNNSAQAAKFFNFCARNAQSDPAQDRPFIGNINGLRTIRRRNMALVLLNSRMIRFSYSENPETLSIAPLAKSDLPLAKDINPDAFFSIAVDLKNFKMPDDIQKDETLKDILHDIVKITFHFSEKEHTLQLVSVATYRSPESAAAALTASRRLTKLLQESVNDPAQPATSPMALLQKWSVADQSRQEDVRVIGTSTISIPQAIELFHSFTD